MALQRSEIRALLWLLPVLAAASWLVWEIGKPHAEAAIKVAVPDKVEAVEVVEIAEVQETPSAPVDESPVLQRFDPNTVEFHDLVRMGFTNGQALGIIKYRERGKVFEIPEDFAACFQVSEEMYRRLKPYIIIGEKYRLKPFERTTNENNIAEAVSEQARESDAPQPKQSPTAFRSITELNSADSTALVAISGIGALTAGRIIELRERLGGFTRIEQLAEVRGMTEQNYERIVTQIFVDTTLITKININFADAKELSGHPYVRPEALRKLLKQRQLKGGWRTAEELKQDNIFTTQELERLQPYLIF